MKWQKVLFVLLLCSSLVLSGCEFKDIDKRFFVVSIGVDKSSDPEKTFHVSVKVAIPRGQVQMGKEDFEVYGVDDSTISNAIQRLKANVDKEFDFGHAKMLMIGESLAKKDYTDVLNWAIRTRFLQRIAWVGVVTPSAERALNVRPSFERLPSNALFLSFGQIGVESEFTVSRYLFDFYRSNEEPGSSPVLPLIQARKGHFIIDSAYVMDGKKAALKLSPEETRLFNTLTHTQNKYEYVIPEGDRKYVFHVDQVKIKRRLESSPKPTAQVDVKLSGTIVERVGRGRVNESEMHEVERLLSKDFKKKVENLLTRFRDENLDPYEFGLLYRATHWDEMEQEVKDWKAMYKKISFNVNVSVESRGSGSIE
ncbi:Ger(x)C family spore germination protein [Tumebacillus sp. ITR2]|uniref:Ger(X)C family spore germination protein n=1 Tax=Tumebacillus amylolyticus TaxID=2801339 RepID=A0ABS1JES9_9BACL|nr:Ger(x)C family spore germination protein [Tumebacillus amylolyticus]MBL0388769.1 Ger(x)C family spore germination protein [Tumebacillus amylolyticus]